MTEWLTFPKDLSLEGTKVHAWRASLDLPEVQIEVLARSLSPDEIIRSEKFHFRRDQKRFIAARGILRNILARYMETEPGKIILSYGPHGKPFSSGPFRKNELSFNLAQPKIWHYMLLL